MYAQSCEFPFAKKINSLQFYFLWTTTEKMPGTDVMILKKKLPKFCQNLPIGQNLAFLTRNKAKFCQNWIIGYDWFIGETPFFKSKISKISDNNT
jgi:hypothetical protein